MSGLRSTTELIQSSRNASLAINHFGGSGSPLIVSHATGFHAHCYQPMMAILTQNFEVWGLDYAGHGASAAPADRDYHWALFAQDLLDALDHLGVAHVSVFGHSMGGAAALLAEKQRPGTVTAAFLYEPIIFPPEIVPRNSMMAEAASNRRREFDSKAEALLRYASRPPLNTMRADALAAYVNHGFITTKAGTVTLACAPETEAATFNNAGTSVEDIRGLQPRTTIAFGESITEPNPAQFAGPAAEALADAVLKSYEGLGHFGPLQDPERIARDVVEFFTQP